jgi:hypothetical protein
MLGRIHGLDAACSSCPYPDLLHYKSCGYRIDNPRPVGTITTMNSKQVIKMLEADGWELRNVKGSHHIF